MKIHYYVVDFEFRYADGARKIKSAILDAEETSPEFPLSEQISAAVLDGCSEVVEIDDGVFARDGHQWKLSGVRAITAGAFDAMKGIGVPVLRVPRRS